MKNQLFLLIAILFYSSLSFGQLCENVHMKDIFIPVIGVEDNEQHQYAWYLNNVRLRDANKANYYCESKEIIGDGDPIVDYYRCEITNPNSPSENYSECFMVHWYRWDVCAWVTVYTDRISSNQLSHLKSVIRNQNISLCALETVGCGAPSTMGSLNNDSVNDQNSCLNNLNDEWTCKSITFELLYIEDSKRQALKSTLMTHRIPYYLSTIACPSSNLTRAGKSTTNDPITAPSDTTSVGN